MPTLFENHVAKWRHCMSCALGSQRTRIVLAKGDIPCEILCLGEAPGQSEDVTGLPFFGPAGRLLDSDESPLGIIQQALIAAHRDIATTTVGYSNLVACFPKLAKKTQNHQPAVDEIKACSPRLREFVDICKPRLVVLVGGLAEKWAHLSVDMANPNVKCVKIMHPSNILSRVPPSNRSLEVQRCVLAITDALEEPF